MEGESGRNKCTHHVALPEGFVAPPGDDIWWPDKSVALQRKGGLEPAKKFPFRLDAFQELSTACLERGESVMVAAHTSSGKTAVAEYAIAMALRDSQRVVYTSPIKVLPWHLWPTPACPGFTPANPGSSHSPLRDFPS